jgi:hypothetical protein
VELTPKGIDVLASLPELKQWKNPDYTTAMDIPLATRQLVEVRSVAMVGPNEAKVEYRWKWAPTSFGEIFDAGNPEVQKLAATRPEEMVKKAGVDAYQGSVHTHTVTMRLSEKGWRVD